MLRSLIALSLALTACDDKDTEFSDGDGYVDDTGLSGTPSSECHWQSANYPFDLDGDGDFETCSTRNADVTIIDMTGTEMWSVDIYGYDNSVVPDSGFDSRVWALVVTDDGVWKAYPYDQIYPDDVHPTEVLSAIAPYHWYSYFNSLYGIDNLNVCAEGCSYYTFGTEIDDALAAAGDTCSNYDDDDASTSHDDMEVCAYLDYLPEPPTPPPAASCTAGHGRFGLVALHWQDLDGDGLYAGMLKPLQETGRGAMTADAIVSKIKLVDAHGATVRAVRDGSTFSFDDSDALVTTARGSTLLSDRRTTSFGVGKVPSLHGTVQFALEKRTLDGTRLEADITWTCPLAAKSDRSSVPPTPQGYTAAVGDFGCSYYKAQQLTVRPIPEDDPTFAEVTLYGMGLHKAQVPLRRNDDADGHRYYFAYDAHGFDIEGSIGDADAGTLPVTLDVLRYHGVDYCTTGTYAIGVER